MNVLRPFGPTIAKVSMSENLVKELNDYVDKTLLDKNSDTFKFFGYLGKTL